MSRKQLSPEGSEITALIVALAAGKRAGMTPEQLARMTGEHALQIAGGDPRQVVRVLGRVIGEQNGFLVQALDKWNEAAGGDPAGEWLVSVGAVAARGRE
ncbi:hypothetical protein ABZV14_01170 [Streptosporangium canum]|uniref:hypothetical protein n=1 Tax=Streptosporangium canum TaxID=324952 RepID=UPI0033BB8B67